MRLTHKQRILNMLQEQEWVSSIELNEVSWRFGGRLFDLRKEGYRFLKKPHPFKRNIELWKLVYTPQAKREKKVDLLKMSKEEQLRFI